MKKIIFSLLTIAIFTSTLAQTLSVKTYGVSPRDVTLSADDILDRAFNGLTNVGVGTKVYLQGSYTTGTPKWEFMNVPFGSAAQFGAVYNKSATLQIISFTPDVTGQFFIKFSNGTQSAVIAINSAKYWGMEGGIRSCTFCHKDIKTEWLTTGHSSMLKRGVEGMLSSSYSSTCISCHTTGFDIDAKNDGFDDYNITFPVKKEVGAYTKLITDFPDAMKKAEVQCEACHGPGSEHLGQTTYSRMSSPMNADVCAYCHDSKKHVYPAQWDVSAHGSSSHLYAQNSTTDRSACMKCHNGRGFIDFIEGKTQTEKELIAITCQTCHDPHSAKNNHQLRTLDVKLANSETITEGGNGKICMNCHQSRTDAVAYTNDYKANANSRFGPHHGPQSDLLMAKNQVTFGQTLPSSGHFAATTNACVDCHMAEGILDNNNNVVLSGSHSFRMTSPSGEDNFKSCQRSECHGGSIGGDFSEVKFYFNGISDHDGDGKSEGLQDEVHGLMEQLAKLLPPVGSTTITMTNNFTLVQAQAYYNYKSIEEDRSFGFHNPKFIVSLLKKSIESLGGIVSIGDPEVDVPSVFELQQNYPNPFNPATSISYNLPKSASVNLVIYDMMGREIKTLVSGIVAAGKHRVVWNGRDNDGNKVSSGIYLYAIKADNFVDSKKMVILK